MTLKINFERNKKKRRVSWAQDEILEYDSNESFILSKAPLPRNKQQVTNIKRRQSVSGLSTNNTEVSVFEKSSM